MRLAIVSGADKGIGFEITKQLAQRGVSVILTARDPKKGAKAQQDLAAMKLHVVFHQLDVIDEKSISLLVQWISKEYGKLDILVNNAGILLDEGESIGTISLDMVRKTMETNFYGPLRLCQALLPLLKKSDDGRIVNMSSGLGSLYGGGGGYPAYSISKTALNALTVKLAAELPNMKINCMSPGWVATDMGGKDAPRTPAEGADTAVWLATASDIPSGKFFENRREIEW